MQEIKNKLIVALDVDNLEAAKKLVDVLSPAVNFFKIGSQLFTAYGPEAIKIVKDKGGFVFLDLKFHDIPNTVKKAVESASKLDVFMLTVHASGTKEMLEAAASVSQRPKIVGVTVLTSSQEKDAKIKVLDLAKRAKEAGLDGVVCSVREAATIRKELGPDFIIVTPGIRPTGSATDDQKRVATPKEAISAGASFIVVGRPIVKADDPLGAAKDIIKYMQ